MNTFDFIPNNTERTTPNEAIVALFLKAFFASRRYKDRGYYGPDMLTPEGELIGFKHFYENKVDLKPCDVDEAFKILTGKGYHISVWTIHMQGDHVWVKIAHFMTKSQEAVLSALI